MPIFVILGATGNVGGAVLDALVKQDDPQTQIRCFVHSREKVYKQNRHVENNSRITTTSGSVADVSTLAECIAGSEVVIPATASDSNVPGCSIALDTAHAVVAACSYNAFGRDVQKDSAASLSSKPPRIIMLSSSTVNDHLSQHVSPTGRWFLHTGLRHIYADLRRAEGYYRMHTSWLTVVFMQPGGLSQAESVGHVLSTEMQHTLLPLADLANAIVELARKRGEDARILAWRNVSVTVPKEKEQLTPFAPEALKKISIGWVWSAFPWLYIVSGWVGCW